MRRTGEDWTDERIREEVLRDVEIRPGYHHLRNSVLRPWRWWLDPFAARCYRIQWAMWRNGEIRLDLCGNIYPKSKQEAGRE